MAVHVLVPVVVHAMLDETNKFGERDEVVRLVDSVVEHAKVAKEVLQWKRDDNEMG